MILMCETEAGRLYTTVEAIVKLFGDLVSDMRTITEDEYARIVGRCREMNDENWEHAWQTWRSEGYASLIAALNDSVQQ